MSLVRINVGWVIPRRGAVFLWFLTLGILSGPAFAEDCDYKHPAVIKSQNIIKDWQEKLPDAESDYLKFLEKSHKKVKNNLEAKAKKSGRIHLKIVYYYAPFENQKYALWGYELSMGPSPLLNIKSPSTASKLYKGYISDEDKKRLAVVAAKQKANLTKCRKLSRSAPKIKSCMERLNRQPNVKQEARNNKSLKNKNKRCERKTNKADKQKCNQRVARNAGFSEYSEKVWCSLEP